MAALDKASSVPVTTPVPPVRQYSFTDWQVNNPTAPPPGDRMDAEYDRANASIAQVINWVEANVGLTTPPSIPGNFDSDAAGSAALAQDYADVTMAWAEHMPDTIPPNILAVMGVTGDHWSSRWWANQAVNIARNAGAFSGEAPPANPYPGQFWFDSANPQLYIWYVDPTSAQWVIATAYAGGLTSDAPSDGQTYGRQNGAWLNIAAGGGYLPITGATPMTGPLTLSGNATLPLHAVPLQQLTAAVSAPITATGSTTPRSAQDRAADVVNVKDFGAVFDGNSHPLSAYYPTLAAAQAVYPHAVALTDEIDGVAIQAAINLCQSRVVQYSYGGTVQLPCGNGLVNQPLVISQPCISLASQGNGFLLNSNVNRQIPTAPTRLTWTGAPRTAGQFQANMLTIAPTDGQRQLNATNVQGILFYCNQVAGAAGPLIASVRHAVIDCATHEPAGIPYPGASLTLGSQAITVSSTAGLRLGESVVSASLPSGAYVAAITDATHFNASVQASASSTETVTIGGEGIRFDVVDGLSDTNDTQYIRVRFKGYALAGAVNATAPLVLIGGSGVVGASGAHFGNTSFCWFHDIHCTYKNGHGVVINNSDHNFHDSLLGQNVGSGPGKLLIVNGTLDSGRVARYHVFGHIGDGGLYTGTDTGGFTTATRGHRILFLDRDNGVPNPVIGAGASVLVCSDLQPVLTFTGGTAATPILAQYPDSTAAGGNARAGNAVDLQSSRTAATQVASGVQSVIAGGRNNVASGQWSLVTGGSGNSATAQAASVIAGNNNLASQQFAVAAGNFASADTYMTLAFGSVMVAGRQAQYNIQVLRAVTAANTTPVVLTADLLAPSTINIVNQTAVSGHQCSAISVTLSATDSTNSANSYVWRQQLGLLKKVASAVTYTPVGTPVSGGSGTTTGIAVVEAADNTNKGYTLTFTPPTGNAVIWRVVATVEWTRVDGA